MLDSANFDWAMLDSANFDRAKLDWERAVLKKRDIFPALHD